ncbi:hypothetical protein BKA59DRAFT_455877 [Fusarium tricinctum]|uniref:Uncharacterized protein n=1 Tax=Fusarium tricinctum TaxID=61284 RepID=A0A8K0RRP5_9HYPO|nr:hypothetical protein BKA59DRAFT_455877 [Fusarium tricinctum]
MENGMSIKGGLSYYHVNYLVEVSVEDSVDINGYVAWRFLIKFERPDGFRTRFDVTFVDFDEDQKRYQKGNAQVSNDLFTRHIVRIGNFWSALGLSIIAVSIGAATIVFYFKYGLWGKMLLGAEDDFLDFKSVILGTLKDLDQI